MSRELTPELSAVVVTPDCYASVRETISHLRAQSVRGSIEVVIVAPSAESLGLDAPELEDFHSFRVVEVGGVESTGRARAAGVVHSSAPIVAFAEEHSYAEPGWAEALIGAHARGWAAVAPEVSNANPESTTSRANFLISFAPWAAPAPAGEADALPWHNTSYKRALLAGYGAALGEMLEAEGPRPE